jgi:hypothetical protein
MLQNLDSIISDTVDIDDLGFLTVEEPEVNPNVVPVDEFRKRQQTETLSFKKPITETEEQPKKKTGRQFIIHNIFVDKFNSKAIRRELTPSVCTVCGFDVAEKRHGRWGLVPVSERQTVIEAVEVHKREAHSLGNLHIIDESEIPRMWLGNHTSF